MASVLLVNVGTITAANFEAMALAAAAYSRAGKPWVLDPVAAGATAFRMQVMLPRASIRGLLRCMVRSHNLAMLSTCVPCRWRVRGREMAP